jgi:hypothetical protein
MRGSRQEVKSQKGIAQAESSHSFSQRSMVEGRLQKNTKNATRGSWSNEGGVQIPG